MGTEVSVNKKHLIKKTNNYLISVGFNDEFEIKSFDDKYYIEIWNLSSAAIDYIVKDKNKDLEIVKHYYGDEYEGIYVAIVTEL